MELNVTFALLVGVTMGLTEVIKRLAKKLGFDSSSEVAPLVALMLGVGLSMGAAGMTFPAFLQGLVIGLSASGLYSGGKTVLPS